MKKFTEVYVKGLPRDDTSSLPTRTVGTNLQPYTGSRMVLESEHLGSKTERVPKFLFFVFPLLVGSAPPFDPSSGTLNIDFKLSLPYGEYRDRTSPCLI